MLRFLVFSVALCAVACSSTITNAPPATPPEKADTTALVAGNTRFALALYGQLGKEPGNLFFSPYSISSALAMTYAGAKGDTATEMQKTLAFPADEQLHPAFRYLNWQLNGDPAARRGYRLAVANRLWGQKGYPWNKEFIANGDKFYGAGLQDLDFAGATEEARQTINTWVEKQTQDRIKELLAKGILSPDTRMVLTNAIYFKGDWQSQFKKDRTQPVPFRLDANRRAEVPMMHQTGTFPYAEDRDVQVVCLPYVGKELEMVVVLPKKVEGLAEVEKSLSPEKLAGWVGRARQGKVELGLPKFKVESGFNLNDALKQMGMPSAFTMGRADFSGITTADRLFISAVIHKAFVEVGEEGTEAAAATAVVLDKDKAPREPETHAFRADHPFLFFIRDTRNDSVLFLGRFVGP